jgi:hypothetical protein
MGGTKEWHGHRSSAITDPVSNITEHYSSDISSTFALVVLSSTDISWEGQRCTYNKTDSVAGCFLFPCSIPAVYFNGLMLGGYIRYYYDGDSITISCGTGSLHGSEGYYLSTP